MIPEIIQLLIGFVLLAVVVGVLFIWVSRSIESLRRGAERFARGDLSRPIEGRGPGRFSALVDSLNQMASQLQARLQTVVQQRNELGAVLSSMVEGLMAIDLEERVINLNRAAAEMFQLEAASTIGRPIQEVVRNSALQAFAAQTLREDTAIQAEFLLRVADPRQEQRQIQAQSAILRDADGKRIGAVMVFHDLTQVRRLEAIRRDFVANVSHEIKTPVTAIKGAVETLLDEWQTNPADAERFLQIIARQADRLAAIIEDLLSLARIEAESGRILKELQPHALAPILAAVRETCATIATQRQATVLVRCAPDLEARIDPPLLEQAVVNLVDNAIKYSAPGKTVQIIGENRGQEVVVTVIDEGRGIEPEHLPRIFERFYRTDRARSRAMGGTGLGLSIVKHVADAHGGRVTVESIPGSGSTFRIHLTAARIPSETAEAE